MVYLTGTPKQVIAELGYYGVDFDINNTDKAVDLVAKTGAWPHSYQLNLVAVHGDAIGTYGYIQSWTMTIDNPETGVCVGAVSGYSIGEVSARMVLRHYEK